MGIPIETVINVGVLTYTGPLMQAFADRTHVLIEPIEDFAPRIRKIYDKKGIDYKLVIVALSERDDEVLMQTKSAHESIAITHARITETAGDGPNYRKVPSKTLASLVGELGCKTPFLLKIDVDGAELDILKGAAGGS